MKRAALYMRVSSLDQHPETQLLDLRQMAAQRGYEIVQEYTDRISGAKARRPGLDEMMADARRGRFDVVLVWASDRIARSVKHFLEVLDELNRLNIEFVSFREQIDTGGPLGRAIVVIIGAIAELERNLIIERVRAGMRRATPRRHATSVASRSISTAKPSFATAGAARAWARSPETTASHEPPCTASSIRTAAQQPCFTRGLKTSPLNPTNERAESDRFGRFKTYTFRNSPTVTAPPQSSEDRGVIIHITLAGIPVLIDYSMSTSIGNVNL